MAAPDVGVDDDDASDVPREVAAAPKRFGGSFGSGVAAAAAVTIMTMMMMMEW